MTAGKGGGFLFTISLICLVSVMIFIFNCENLFTGRLRIVLVFVILTIATRISESLLCNTRVTMAISKNVRAPFDEILAQNN